MQKKVCKFLSAILLVLLFACGSAVTAFAAEEETPSLRIISPAAGETVRGEVIFYADYTGGGVQEYNIYLNTETAVPEKRVYTSSMFDPVVKVDTSPVEPGNCTFLAEVKAEGGEVYTASVRVYLNNIKGEIVSYIEGSALRDYFAADMAKEMTENGVKLTNTSTTEHWTGVCGQQVSLDFSRDPHVVVDVTDFSDAFQLRLRGDLKTGGYAEQVHISQEYTNRETDCGAYDIDLYAAIAEFSEKDQNQMFLNQIANDSVQTVRLRPWVFSPAYRLGASVTVRSIAFYYPEEGATEEPDYAALGEKIETGNRTLSLEAADWSSFRGTAEKTDAGLLIRENTVFNKGGAVSAPVWVDINGDVRLKLRVGDLSGKYAVGLRINDGAILLLADDGVQDGDIVVDVKARLAASYPDQVFENANPMNFVKTEWVLYAKGSDAGFALQSAEVAYDADAADTFVSDADAGFVPSTPGRGGNDWMIPVFVSVGVVVVAAAAVTAVLVIRKKKKVAAAEVSVQENAAEDPDKGADE